MRKSVQIAGATTLMVTFIVGVIPTLVKSVRIPD